MILSSVCRDSSSPYVTRGRGAVKGGHEREEIGRPGDRRVMHARHVKFLVRVGDDVAKSRGANETVCERHLDDACILQAPERIRVALRRPGVERDARADG